MNYNRICMLSVLSALVLLLPACANTTPVPTKEVFSDLPRDTDPQVADADLAALVEGNSDFAFAVYPQIISGEENAFFSPYSISIALAMTYAGAKGETASQMAQVLHFLLPAERLHPAFNKLALELESRSELEGVEPDQAFQLSVANSIWGQIGYRFEQDFLDALARNYAAGMRLVDYENDAEAARQEINDWVSRSTNQKIKDIIPQGTLDALTRLVLANAVYFKATWQTPFDPRGTRDEPFRLLDGSSVTVSMMTNIQDLTGMQGDGFSVVELPYTGGQLSMMILLPDQGRFQEVEATLNTALVDGICDAMESVGPTAFSMPKFMFEGSFGLADGLKALGMQDAFDPAKADFSGMESTGEIYLSDALHKAYISVDEQGTEAGASTVVQAVGFGGGSFTVDRPFLFLIRDNPTGTILFLGRVMNPTA